MTRMSVERAAMASAWIWSNRGTCPKKQVGAAVLSVGGRLIATGYNGAPPGEPHCVDHGCILNHAGDCVRSVHAEANALTLAGVRSRGGVLFSTHYPCPDCARLAVEAGVSRVIYEVDRLNDDRRKASAEILANAGILLEQWRAE